MLPCTKRGWTLTTGWWLLSTLCSAQTISASTTATWHDGELEVKTQGGAPWILTVPFRQLTRNPGLATQLHQSTVTVQETMHPEGPTRAARAVLHARTWLQWGRGKAPLAIGDWTYHLVEQISSEGTSSYLWVTADLGKKLKATPEQIQTVRNAGTTWCTWFAVRGERISNPHIADGPTPTIDWMLWRKPAGATCR